jgi:hypothetical protein
MEPDLESLGYGDIGDDPQRSLAGETHSPPSPLYFLPWLDPKMLKLLI